MGPEIQRAKRARGDGRGRALELLARAGLWAAAAAGRRAGQEARGKADRGSRT